MEWMVQALLFILGGSGYCAIELIWRGWTHWTMFLLGGLCFVLMGHLQQTEPRLSRAGQLIWASCICTFAELLFGLVFNRDWRIWDYRSCPMNWGGQICLGYSLLWIPLSAAALELYRLCRYRIFMLVSEFHGILGKKRKDDAL